MGMGIGNMGIVAQKISNLALSSSLVLTLKILSRG